MLISHDLGTTGDKASLHEDDGRMVASVTVSYAADYRSGGSVEQDPRDWENAVVEATRQLVARTGVAPQSVIGLAISGQMMAAVLLDGDLQPLRPAMIWADTRATRQTQQLIDRVGEERGYGILGHRLNPTYSLPKIMWVRDHEPEVFARVRHACLAKDYVVAQLTGRLATDRSDASGMNAYDLEAGTWSEEILQAAELDSSILPEILGSPDVVGNLTPQAAEAMGLSTSAQVVMGGGDGPIAAVGSGIISPDDGAYVCLGTSSWISFSSTQPALDPDRRTFTFSHVVPDHFVPTATVQSAGASLAWIHEVLSPDGHEGVDALVSEASTEDAETGGLYFLPYLMGERSPLWNPAARGSFVGIGRHHGRAHLVRAVLEGVAFNLDLCLEAFAATGHRFAMIDAVGGGAVSDVWLQIMADVWGIPVRRRSVAEEANSLGAAVVAAVGLGTADFDAARSLSEVVAEFTPRPDRHEQYTARLDRFQAATTALSPWDSASAGREE